MTEMQNALILWQHGPYVNEVGLIVVPLHPTLKRNWYTWEALGFKYDGNAALVRSAAKEHNGKRYDRIVMNPPFEKGQDVGHVIHAYELLKPGGRLVSIMSPAIKFNQQRKYTEFRQFLEEHNGWYEDLPADAFKESGTGVQTVLVVLDK